MVSSHMFVGPAGDDVGDGRLFHTEHLREVHLTSPFFVETADLPDLLRGEPVGPPPTGRFGVQDLLLCALFEVVRVDAHWLVASVGHNLVLADGASDEREPDAVGGVALSVGVEDAVTALVGRPRPKPTRIAVILTGVANVSREAGDVLSSVAFATIHNEPSIDDVDMTH